MKNNGERSLKSLNMKWLVLLAAADVLFVLLFELYNLHHLELSIVEYIDSLHQFLEGILSHLLYHKLFFSSKKMVERKAFVNTNKYY